MSANDDGSEFLRMGTVYGTLLNFRAELAALGDAVHQPPYKAPPQAPVLYIKPANTWSADDAVITLPAGIAELEVGATVACVMKGPGELAGYVLMNDMSIPHASLFRPPVKFKCLDGSLAVGATLLPAENVTDVAGLSIQVRINGVVKQTVKFDALVRSPQQLLAAVGEFMTLGAGDVLMLGCDVDRPRARAGDTIDLLALGLGTLTTRLVAGVAP